MNDKTQSFRVFTNKGTFVVDAANPDAARDAVRERFKRTGADTGLRFGKIKVVRDGPDT